MTKIRAAHIEDAPSILNLIKDLAVFEKEPNAVEITENDLVKDGFGDTPKFKCFVAEESGRIIGMALVYTRFSTWKGEVLHLEDLIVEQNHRGQGVGTQLLDAVVAHAKAIQVKRVSWEVLDWNSKAIDFYKSKGANVMPYWDVVHLDENGIKNYLKAL